MIMLAQKIISPPRNFVHYRLSFGVPQAARHSYVLIPVRTNR
jgi:hypothetical protein